ncbi:MAG: hypothetical protein ACD_9C00151G0003 [uncultured bacterium]|nr:MAG: hypothetical protein ACD_9C00151G0003 [uncultured bacterium]
MKKYFAKKENLYLVLALVAGIVMVFLNPPFAGVPDEHIHFLRVSHMAQGNVLCSDGQIKKASLDLPDEIKPIRMNGSNDEKISLGKIKKALFEKDTDEAVQFGGVNCGANPLGYFPQAAGMMMADSLSLPALWGFYFARLFNALVAIFITYMAIKLLPFGKIIFLLIGLLPMTMQQYASLSYDPLHISLVFLFSAYVLNISVRQGKISKKEMILVALSAIFAANAKWGFFPIMLLLFVLPKDKFLSNKKYWSYIVSVIFVGAAVFLLSKIGSVSSDGQRDGIYPLEQILFVLKNPFNFLLVVVNTLYIDANSFLESFLYKPGWLNFGLAPMFYLFTFLGIVLIIRSEKEEVGLTKKQRFIIGLTALLSFLFVFFSLYVFWTKVGGEKVHGVQGRYLISIFPLLVLAFYKSGFNFRFDWIKKKMEWVVGLFVIIVFISAFFSIWYFYYDKNQVIGKYIYDPYVTKEEIKNAEAKNVQGVFTQTFKVKKDDFLGVKFYVKKNIYNGKAIFFLKDAQCGEILKRKELTWDQDEFSSIELKFGSVSGSKNNVFCLQGELMPDTEIMFKTTNKRYSDGSLSYDSAQQEEDLIFDLMYEN